MKLALSLMKVGQRKRPSPTLVSTVRGVKGGHWEGTIALAPGWVVGILPDCIEDTGINETKATTERVTEIPCQWGMSRELRAP